MLNVESSDHIIKNAERPVFETLPMFDGANTESWIEKADWYYIHRKDDYKLDKIFLNLSEDVCSWFAEMLCRKKNQGLG